MEAPVTRALIQATAATVCQVSMGPTVKTTLMTAQAISVLMGGPVWTESTHTTASVPQSGLVRNLFSHCLDIRGGTKYQYSNILIIIVSPSCNIIGVVLNLLLLYSAYLSMIVHV